MDGGALMTRSYEVETKDGMASAIVEVSGRWTRATLECPEECPDCDIVQTWQKYDDGHEDGELQEREVDPSTLPDEVADELIEAALMLDSERDDCGER